MEDYKKKYEDALERAKEELGSGCFNKGSIEYIFPELKEDNDERIRKELIDAIHDLWDNDALPMPLSVKRKDEWISWLEKQGGNCSIVDIDKMVDDFAHKEVKGYGKPSMIEIDAYRKGIEDALAKQGWQKPFNYENANIQQKDFALPSQSERKSLQQVLNDMKNDVDYFVRYAEEYVKEQEQKSAWSEEDK